MYDNEEIEDFIEDWYWDKASHEFARQMARFLRPQDRWMDTQ
ncbi:hypothetical protein ES703_115587 [subsurface metagenome]